MFRKFLLPVLLVTIAFNSFSQGVGIPSKKAGIAFGNLPVFNGLRFNFRDKNVENQWDKRYGMATQERRRPNRYRKRDINRVAMSISHGGGTLRY